MLALLVGVGIGFAFGVLTGWTYSLHDAAVHDIECDLDEDCSCGAER